jgi:hypothetical protein
MADTADELLRAIRAVYRKWLDGALSQEDALFEIGDLLGQPAPGAGLRPARPEAEG